jgi:hypothetical protein
MLCYAMLCYAMLCCAMLHRFAVSQRGQSLSLEGMQEELARVPLLQGRDSGDAAARHSFRASPAAQSEWLGRAAQQVFECALPPPELRAMLACLSKSCEADPGLERLDSYALWPRLLAIAVKTMRLVGSKAAGEPSLA